MNKRRSLARRLLAPIVGRGRSIAKDEDGAVAVEFAILALPFFALIFATLETSLTFFAQQILESALQDSTRAIRTGQSQADWDSDRFREEICSRTFGLFECSADNADTERLRIKVEPVTNFDTAIDEIGLPVSPDCSMPGATDDDCEWTLAESFNDGQGSDVIIAQAFYKWPTLVNLPWLDLADQAGGNKLLSAVRVFKNEPF